jgi:hypothetical protein
MGTGSIAHQGDRDDPATTPQLGGEAHPSEQSRTSRSKVPQ